MFLTEYLRFLAVIVYVNKMLKGKKMEQINSIGEGIQNLLLNLTSNIFDDDIDNYGVGAMMPQDLPEEIMLNNTAHYGI